MFTRLTARFAWTFVTLSTLSMMSINQTSAQELLTPDAAVAKNNDAPSYLVGYQFGKQLASGGFNDKDFKTEGLIKGLLDALKGSKPALTTKELEAAASSLDQIAQARMQQMQAKMQDMAKTNLTKSKEFMAENGKKDGVQTLKSGLQYKVLKKGSGKSPTESSQVKVHYQGTLTNGEVFDSSIERGEPIDFPVNGVIAGWTEALQRMVVGDKWQLFIPPELAYGERGRQGAIGPNEALIFEIELLDIIK